MTLLSSLKIMLRDKDNTIWTDAEFNAAIQEAARTVGEQLNLKDSTAETLFQQHPERRSVIIDGAMSILITSLEPSRVKDPDLFDRYQLIEPNVTLRFIQGLEFIRTTQATIRGLKRP